MEDWSLPATSITVNVSGHDAATLGGLPPSFYLNAANLTGTIDPARIPGLDWTKITEKPTSLAGYGIIAGTGLTETGNSINVNGSAGRIVANADSLDLATVGTPGTYTKLTTDSYGRVISGTTLNASDITSGSFADARLVGPYTGITSLTSKAINISDVGTNTRGIQFLGSNLKWYAYITTGGESGNNTGADFQLRRYLDNLNSSAVFIANRETGSISLYGTAPSTSTTTGALTVVGGIGCQDIYANTLNGQLNRKKYTTATRPVPSSTTEGQIWYNTTTKNVEFATDTTIKVVAAT